MDRALNKSIAYPGLVKEVYNNTWFANPIYSYYEHTGDLKFLADHFDIMEDFILFVVDLFVEDRGTHMIVKKCEGLGRIGDLREDERYITCATLLKSLMDYRHAIALLKRTPVIEPLDETIRKLTAGLK